LIREQFSFKKSSFSKKVHGKVIKIFNPEVNVKKNIASRFKFNISGKQQKGGNNQDFFINKKCDAHWNLGSVQIFN
jgi:hypothetical protein